MAIILGYGEDALTYWALSRHLDKVLERLGDTSKPQDCLVFFRPSFGRGGGSQFGEFDAILATLEKIYLIESKWDGFSDDKDSRISLKDCQTIRQDVFEWYHKKWTEGAYDDWEDFIKKQENKPKPHNKKIAPPGSLLANNLQFVLKTLQEHETKHGLKIETENILLYFSKENKTIEPPEGFRPVTICYTDPNLQPDFVGLSKKTYVLMRP